MIPFPLYCCKRKLKWQIELQHKISPHAGQIVRISPDINIDLLTSWDLPPLNQMTSSGLLRQLKHLGATGNSDTWNKPAFCVYFILLYPFFHTDEQSVRVRVKTVKQKWKHPTVVSQQNVEVEWRRCGLPVHGESTVKLINTSFTLTS